MWQIPDTVDLRVSSIPSPVIANEDEVKRAFGIALAEGKNPFDAALAATNNNTNLALYVSQRWLNDPIVVKARKNTVHNSKELLDAEELAARLLEMAEERDRNNLFYILEGKDRLAALKLYADIRGYTKKDAIPIGGNTFIQNTMTIRLVEPEKKAIESKPVEEVLEPINNSPIKLKLVG